MWVHQLMKQRLLKSQLHKIYEEFCAYRKKNIAQFRNQFISAKRALYNTFINFESTKKKASLLDYLLTPWSRVLLEKLTGTQLVKKFPAFYGTRRFITTFTSAHQLSLPEPARSSPCPHIPLSEDPS